MSLGLWNLPHPPADLAENWARRLDAGGVRDLTVVGAELPGLLEAMAPPGLKARAGFGSVARASGAAVQVHLEADLVADSKTVGVLTRDIDTGAGRAVHWEFSLASPWQGQGRGRRAICQSVALYLALGLDEVTVEAAEAGAYAWAMCGFDFADAGERERVVNAAEGMLARLHLIADLDQIVHAWDFSRLLGAVRLQELVRAREDAPPLVDLSRLWDPETEIALGKALLLTSDHGGWSGRLILERQSPGLRQLARYADLDELDGEETAAFFPRTV